LGMGSWITSFFGMCQKVLWLEAKHVVGISKLEVTSCKVRPSFLLRLLLLLPVPAKFCILANFATSLTSTLLSSTSLPSLSTMKTKRLYLALLLNWARFGVAETFSSIFSIHTERARYCPESYEPDEDYIACCWWQATLTSARGPDKSMSPACCDKTATCSGPAPVMFDWTTNEYGFMVTITPPDKTSKVPQTNEPDITTTDFGKKIHPFPKPTKPMG
jgi:hypothetical protein